MLNIRQVTWKRWVVVPILVAFAAACTEDQPTVTGVSLAKGGGGGKAPTVDDTEPPGAPQDTMLDVQIFGSGFDNGSVAEFTLDGVPTPKVRTNSTRFVRQSELVANVTITLDADTALYDVEVMTTKGKKGVGADLFKVVEKGKPVLVDDYAIIYDGGGLWVVNSDGRNERAIWEQGLAMRPSWAPHGDGSDQAPWSVVFSTAECEDGLYRLAVDTVGGTPRAAGDPVPLIGGVGTCYTSPAWSPLGGSIAFSNWPAGDPALYVMPASGGSPTVEYMAPASHVLWGLTWSPDEGHIAFAEGPDLGFQSLVIYNRTSNTAVTVLEEEGTFEKGSLRSLDWARTQPAIAFAAAERPKKKVVWYVYVLWLEPDGTGDYRPRTDLPENPQKLIQGGGARWSPDDSEVLFQGGSGLLQAYHLATGNVRILGGGGFWGFDWRR